MSDTQQPSSPPSPSGAPARGRPWWVTWLLRPLAALFGLALAGVLSVLLLAALGLAVAYPNLPEVRGLADYRPKIPLRVYSSDGVLIGEYGEEKREFTPIRAIPKVMRDAVLAIEDARFYQHGGVDYVGVLRAGLANFSESRSQGASTITMQVAKNYFLTSERSFSRKISEILLALQIERELSKNEILELYVNKIYLGHRAYGIEAASQVYYGQSIKDLSLAQLAMIAGLPKAPSAFNPLVNPTRSKERRDWILGRMQKLGYIDQQRYEQTIAAKLIRLEPERQFFNCTYFGDQPKCTD